MLIIDILDNKINTTINGFTFLDLITKSINTDTSISFSGVYATNQEMVMRPDLAAMAFCGDTKKMGTLLKVNGISNPFSLDMNEILFIPNSDTCLKLQNKPQVDQKNNARATFRKQLQDRISQTSTQRQNYLDALDMNAATQTPLPPNVTTEGSSQQFIVKDGKLIFGTNIGVCRTNIQQNKSVATIKSRFAQNQIFES